MPQFNIPYNNWEDGDVAYAAQVLANFNAILGAINSGLGADNLAANSVTDVKIGARTINDATAAIDTAQLTAHLSGLANRIKAITGEGNWKTTPVKSLKTMNTAVVTAVADSAAAVITANTANTKADSAVSTANTADSNATTALNTANTALGQDTTEPYTGALGAIKIANAVKDDYEIQKPEIEQAVIDAEAAVASVAGKADVAYVDQVAADFVLGTVPDNSLTNAKLGTDIKIGSLATLTTTDKTSTVNAINEVDEALDTHKADLITDTGGVHGLEVEYGTWTPVLKGASVAGVHVYSQQTGTYGKIGKKIRCSFSLAITTKDATMIGNVRIGGLPIVTASSEYGGISFSTIGNVTLSTGQSMLLGRLIQNSDSIALTQAGSSLGTAFVSSAAINDNTILFGSFEYEIN